MNEFNENNHRIKSYLQYLVTLKYSSRTVISHKHALNRLFSFLTAQKITRFADVTLKDLEAYRLDLIDKKYAGESISAYLRAVRKLFQHLEETGQIFINPAGNLVIPRVKEKLQPIPTQEEMETLLALPDVSTPTGIRDRAVIETFYSTGVRLTELTSMNVHDTDLKQGRIKVTGKGSKQRVVPLGRKAVSWTARYLKQVRPEFLRRKPDQPALWLGFQGRRINHLIVERFISEYGKKAGIRQPVTPHALRRACATHMLRNGAHPVQIQMLLGHSTLRALSRYLRVTITDMMKTHSQTKVGK